MLAPMYKLMELHASLLLHEPLASIKFLIKYEFKKMLSVFSFFWLLFEPKISINQKINLYYELSCIFVVQQIILREVRYSCDNDESPMPRGGCTVYCVQYTTLNPAISVVGLTLGFKQQIFSEVIHTKLNRCSNQSVIILLDFH